MGGSPRAGKQGKLDKIRDEQILERGKDVMKLRDFGSTIRNLHDCWRENILVHPNWVPKVKTIVCVATLPGNRRIQLRRRHSVARYTLSLNTGSA
ncbi:hypothetical protein R1flu_020567 [Riccia fluitans]|uniref:Uncharacterized protein n=1 Tax=Riccia fluitans TaxID=41844 RepID=A0ABD1ZLV9_9MARC